MTYTVGSKVYLGVDNTSVISSTDTGRKSIWLESKESFLHGVLIGDFAHVPGSICGLWPGLYVVPFKPSEILTDNNLVVAGQSATNLVLPMGKSTFWSMYFLPY